MWYSASLLFRGVHDVVPEVPSLWEELIVLVEADSERDAKQHAERLGAMRRHHYVVTHPETHVLKWVFVQVERVCSIEEDRLEPGVELFSRFLRQSEVDSLLTPFNDDPVR